MAKQVQTGSLTSDFRARATSADIAERRAAKKVANQRNKANQKAMGEWHNASRGKQSNIPFPERRTH
jgi:hypothetical protein